VSDCPTVDRVLAIREELANAVSGLAAREQRLNVAFGTRTGSIRTAREAAGSKEREAVEEAVAERQARYAEESAALGERCAARERRLERALASSRERLRIWVEGAQGRRKNKIQIALMEAERVHDADLESEQEQHRVRRETLSAGVSDFSGLELESRRRFREYAGCVRLRGDDTPCRESDCPDGHEELIALSRREMESVRAALAELKEQRLFRVGRCVSLWLLVPVMIASLAAAILGAFRIAPIPGNYVLLAWGITGIGAALCALHALGRRVACPIARTVARHLDVGRTALTMCGTRLVDSHKRRMAEIEDLYQGKVAGLEREWEQPAAIETAGLFKAGEDELNEKSTRLNEWHARTSQARRDALEKTFEEDVRKLEEDCNARISALEERLDAQLAEATRENEEGWSALAAECGETLPEFHAAIATARMAADELFPDWTDAKWDTWAPPEQFADAVRFGRMDVDLAALCERLPEDPSLAPSGAGRFSMPLCLTFPGQGSLLFETRSACRDSVLGALNNVVMRLLSVAPPGKVAFTIVDPVELGQNFAGIMHLADFEESVVNRRIWTQPRHIEERLADLNEHMEKVIQMYLRNEYATIADYNRQAGEIAEKYHFLVVADFPVNFTELAARRLLSIASSGPRCGVYVLLHWDRRRQTPQDFVSDELRDNTLRLTGSGRDFVFPGRDMRGTAIVLDEPPEPDRATDFLKEVGRQSIDSNRVEVPFARVAPDPDRMWSLNTERELRVPIGRTGATKLQYLALGEGTLQHALIAGKTGSGKSTLFHVLISNLALWCSPDEVEFYLVDFKKGVEFKCYATRQLPHARVVAIESDREFGLSVLERVDEELKRRGDLFRDKGVQDFAAYRASDGAEAMPRTLLVVDEFQEFFVEEDRISQAASLLLDRIVRQGRAFGIHVLLGSQTLGGAYTLTRATLGQMTIRIALQCNEADAYLIMDDENPAPRLLSRPGEALYNDAAGRMEGNSPFQVVWLTDEERERRLSAVSELAADRPTQHPAPVVFEGNMPAAIASNVVLRRLLADGPGDIPAAARIWLGEPNRIKGPTEVEFARQSGNNLLVVGQRDEAVLAMVGMAMVSLAAQYAPGKLKLTVVDGSPPGSAGRAFLESVRDAIARDVALATPGDIPAVVDELWQEMKRREGEGGDADSIATFCLIRDVQKYKALRYEEDYGFSTSSEESAPDPGRQLNDLIQDGSSLGIHLVLTCDTYGNVGRNLSRKAVGEFDKRVLFQMSPTDSASLIDSPAASRLGMYRALFYSEQEGYVEMYRPYALPDDSWLDGVARSFAGVR